MLFVSGVVSPALTDATVPPLPFIASAPARVDLAGGWTDVPPYATEVGGAVCNVAIDMRALATVTSASMSIAPSEALLRAAWQRAGEPAVTIAVKSAIPVGSGLGGSSAAGVALAAALAAHGGRALDPHDLAELSRSTEAETMGLPGGCQDHYAAAFGGALLLTCRRQTIVHPVLLSDECITEFERCAMIAYTGASRMSATTITAVLEAWRAGEAQTCESLQAMAALAPAMANALAAADLEELGRLVSRQWTAQRALHPTITTPAIEQIVQVCVSAGATGVKALGASGGGCVLVIARSDRIKAVRDALAARASILPLRVSRSGVQAHAGTGGS